MNIVYKSAVFIIITGVILAGISFPMVEQPKVWYELPKIPGLQEKARIIFLHVPTAWLSVVAFLVSMVYSIVYLRKRDIYADVKAFASAEIGFLFCILATVTGSVWAKFNWGSFWNWDPRETSIFILLLIYGAYFSLRSAIDNPEQKAKLASVYSIIAFITVPFFIFIMPRLVETLHPDPIINDRGKINMSPNMQIIFFSSLTGFTLLFFWMLNVKVRLENLRIKKLNVN